MDLIHPDAELIENGEGRFLMQVVSGGALCKRKGLSGLDQAKINPAIQPTSLLSIVGGNGRLLTITEEVNAISPDSSIANKESGNVGSPF